MPWKHPRIRGENVVEAKSHKNNMETSPHTRGEPSRETILRELHRNIPAYAGRTSGDVSFYRQVGKHPRIRGENPRKVTWRLMVLETSPHTRGERSVPTPFQGSFGNIPAYAGRTQLLTLLLALRGKHPRIRGENVNPTYLSRLP